MKHHRIWFLIIFSLLFVNSTNRDLSVTYEWDFGDGSSFSTEQNPTHTYAQTGIYTWKLKTTIQGGTYQTTGKITVLATLPPKIFLGRSRLKYGALPGSMSTSSQRVTISNAGDGTLNWTAIAQQAWITVSPGSVTGAGELSVGVNAAGLAAGTYYGTITVSDLDATNNPQTITVTLTVYKGGTNPPIGVMDTPTDGTTGIEGSVPVTGWVVDDIEVLSAKIYRDPVGGENPGPTGYVYIGDAVFVEGARPDVERAYPNYPLNEKAGWGYMMLTNFLPNHGNGTFRIHAIATDKEGNATLLGSKTITCDNANAVKPFGAIDTPTQGGMASGNKYVNFGWALTRPPNSIATNGLTIWVYVNGVPLGHPVYNNYRKDIADLFPGYANSNGAVGYYYLNTTGYANGVHTIAWGVTDSGGKVAGIGSRYFTIQNVGGSSKPGIEVEMESQSLPAFGFVPDTAGPVFFRRGFNPEAVPEAAYPERDGVIRIEIAEVERLAMYLRQDDIDKGEFELRAKGGKPSGRGVFAGYLVVGDEVRPLPVGSTFDGENGVFLWQPGPGFLGVYTFWIVDIGRQTKKTIEVRIVSREGDLS